MTLPPDFELRGVRLNDVYRDRDGALWEVYALCDQPQAYFRKVGTDETTHMVIGSRNFDGQWKEGPLRPPA